VALPGKRGREVLLPSQKERSGSWGEKSGGKKFPQERGRFNGVRRQEIPAPKKLARKESGLARCRKKGGKISAGSLTLLCGGKVTSQKGKVESRRFSRREGRRISSWRRAERVCVSLHRGEG